MKYLKIIALILMFLFSISNLQAQDNKGGGIIKTAGGILLIWNETDNNFTIEIRGNEIRPTERRMMFAVDGRFVQLMTVPKKDFLKKDQIKMLDDKALLLAHRDWESQYLGNILNSELQVDSSWQKLANGMEALCWSFEMPAARAGKDAMKQIYLVVSKGNHVLLLNSAIAENVDEKTVRQFLIDTMGTLKINKKALSLKQAQEEILKGN